MYVAIATAMSEVSRAAAGTTMAGVLLGQFGDALLATPSSVLHVRTSASSTASGAKSGRPQSAGRPMSASAARLPLDAAAAAAPCADPHSPLQERPSTAPTCRGSGSGSGAAIARPASASASTRSPTLAAGTRYPVDRRGAAAATELCSWQVACATLTHGGQNRLRSSLRCALGYNASGRKGVGGASAASQVGRQPHVMASTTTTTTTMAPISPWLLPPAVSESVARDVRAPRGGARRDASRLHTAVRYIDSGGGGGSGGGGPQAFVRPTAGGGFALGPSAVGRRRQDGVRLAASASVPALTASAAAPRASGGIEGQRVHKQRSGSWQAAGSHAGDPPTAATDGTGDGSGRDGGGHVGGGHVGGGHGSSSGGHASSPSPTLSLSHWQGQHYWRWRQHVIDRRRQLQQSSEAHHAAARRVQATHRGRLCRSERRRQHAAATALQSAHRGSACRRAAAIGASSGVLASGDARGSYGGRSGSRSDGGGSAGGSGYRCGMPHGPAACAGHLPPQQPTARRAFSGRTGAFATVYEEEEEAPAHYPTSKGRRRPPRAVAVPDDDDDDDDDDDTGDDEAEAEAAAAEEAAWLAAHGLAPAAPDPVPHVDASRYGFATTLATPAGRPTSVILSTSGAVGASAPLVVLHGKAHYFLQAGVRPDTLQRKPPPPPQSVLRRRRQARERLAADKAAREERIIDETWAAVRAFEAARARRERRSPSRPPTTPPPATPSAAVGPAAALPAAAVAAAAVAPPKGEVDGRAESLRTLQEDDGRAESLRTLHRVLSDVQCDAFVLQGHLNARSRSSAHLRRELSRWRDEPQRPPSEDAAVALNTALGSLPSSPGVVDHRGGGAHQSQHAFHPTRPPRRLP